VGNQPLVQYSLGELAALDEASRNNIVNNVASTTTSRRERRGTEGSCVTTTIEVLLKACVNDPTVDYEITDTCAVDELKATYSVWLPITKNARLCVCCTARQRRAGCVK
jgi:hypothetical protein